MKATQITTTKTATSRTVSAVFDDGTTRAWTWGPTRDEDGLIALPDPDMVAREALALIAEIEGREDPEADTVLAAVPALAEKAAEAQAKQAAIDLAEAEKTAAAEAEALAGQLALEA